MPLCDECKSEAETTTQGSSSGGAGLFARLFAYLRSEPKLWKVGEHRVKAITVKYSKGYPPVKKSKTRYKCVDCEKTRHTRPDFKNEECYEVVQQ